MEKLEMLQEELMSLLNESEKELSELPEDDKDYEYWSGYNTAITLAMRKLAVIKNK